MTSEPGSFARATIVERKPQIIARVIADHAYPSAVVARLEAFRDEISSEAVQPLREKVVGEADVWYAEWARYEGHSWLELPWYFAETYFYRRLLEAVAYFQPGPWYEHDPFRVQKEAQEAEAIEQVAEAWKRLRTLAPEARFAPLLHAALWGNRADLSNLTVRERAVGDTAADQANIIVDHTRRVHRLLARDSGRPGAVAFINDNVGADSLFDLILADHLLAQGYARDVTFHLKNQPFFVSDAMPADIERVVDKLVHGGPDELVEVGARLTHALTTGALELATHPFWTRPQSFYELPAELESRLTSNDLTILKGDVNYRRLLADRHWPADTPLEEAAAPFPTPVLVLRTLKGEIIAGLARGRAESLQAEDPDWLINGKRGLIQLVE
jgi:uncharacterized protein with ATP-grasp and redox domains